MNRRMLSPAGAGALFAALAIVVVGGLAWVTLESLRLEAEQRQASARADAAQAERLALWKLDGRLYPVWGVESSRLYVHYFPLHTPLTLVGAQKPGDEPPLVPSPLLTADLPSWMKLHVQLDPDRGWDSPQVMSSEVETKFHDQLFELYELPSNNLNGVRSQYLADLKQKFDVKHAYAQLMKFESVNLDDSPLGVPYPFEPVPVVTTNGMNVQLNGAFNSIFPNTLPRIIGPADGVNPTVEAGNADKAGANDPRKEAAAKDAAAARGGRGVSNPAQQVGNGGQGGGQGGFYDRANAGRTAVDTVRSKTEGVANTETPNAQPAPNAAMTPLTPNTTPSAATMGPTPPPGASVSSDSVPTPVPSPTPPAAAPSGLSVPTPALKGISGGGTNRPGAVGNAPRADLKPVPLTGAEKKAEAKPENKTDAKPAAQADKAKVMTLKAQEEQERRKSAGEATPKSLVDDGKAPAKPAPPDPVPLTELMRLQADAVKQATQLPQVLPQVRDSEKNNFSLNRNPERRGLNFGNLKLPAVHLGPMRPVWLTSAAGVKILMLVRAAKLESKVVFQGIVLDWPALQAELTDEVKPQFPDAKLEPAANEAVDNDRRMSAVPAVLDPGPEPVPPPAGATPLRIGLSLGWLAAILALGATGFVGWTLIDLSERRIRFVSAVTHELRTPLTSLRLYLDLLTSGMIADETQQKEYLHTLNNESDRLNRLIENVLDFAKLEKRTVQAHCAPTKVADLLDAIAQSWRDRLAGDGRELVVHSTLPSESLVHTDARIAAQILGNLVDNARKYAASAEDRRIWVWAKPGDAGTVHLEVEDRGPGVPAGERAGIFKPFRRGAAADTTAGGAGLGLALARQWAEMLRGRLTCRPAAGGVGACFRLELPVMAKC